MTPAITSDAKAYIPMGELIDVSKERERLSKEKDKAEQEIERIDRKLSNEGFIAKAPQNVIDAEKAKRETHLKTLENIEKAIADLEKL